MLKILLSKILYKFLLCIKIVSEIFPREQSIEQNIIRSIVVNGRSSLQKPDISLFRSKVLKSSSTCSCHVRLETNPICYYNVRDLQTANPF